MKESNKNLPNYGIKLFYLECNNNKKNNMIVLHGLLGNSNDFISLCQHKNISEYANSYIVDLRNHGKSPHTQTNSIDDLADDLYLFIIQHQLQYQTGLIIMGHSMGAMAIMRFTQKYSALQNIIDRIILIDINCIPDQSDDALPKTITMLKRLSQISLSQPTGKLFSQIEDKSLTKSIAQIMKSNIRIISQNQHEWISNLPTLIKQFHYLTNFQLHDNHWKKPVQVIYGCKSNHLNKQQIDHYCRLYPQMNMKQNFHEIQGGHWVHFENPNQFLKTMELILQRDKQQDKK